MSTKYPLCAVVLAALTLTSAFAQVVPTDPNYTVTVVTDDVLASGERMAADRFDNVYISHSGGSVTRVTPSGNVMSNYLTGIGHVGQITTNPVDGRAYMVETSPQLPVILARVWRLDPAGATQLFNVDVVAEGFTIDNLGRYWFGGVGLSGPGIYRLDPPVASTSPSVIFIHPGLGANRILQALVDGDVLVADGAEVRRYTMTSAALVPYANYQNQPNTFAQVRAVTRMPFNQFGAGAMIGVDRFSTFSGAHVGEGYPGDLTGGSNAPLLIETPDFNAFQYRSLASGYQQSLYWLADHVDPTSPAVQVKRRLQRVDQVPAHGSQGSLIITQTPVDITFDLYGRVGVTSPFLLVGTTGPAPANIFLPAIGYVDVNPFATGFFALVDGVGVFGPANPLGNVPGNGHWSLTVSYPSFGPVAIPVKCEAYILDGLSTNGAFFITNLDLFAL